MGIRRAAMGPMEPDATPPGVAAEGATCGDAAAVRCPWCASPRVERIAAFGAQLMSEQYMCLVCRSPFERIRK